MLPLEFDLIKEHYFFELNRKQQLEAALGFPVTVLAMLAGVVGFFVRYLYPFSGSACAWVFSTLLFCSIVCLLLAFYQVVRAFSRGRYQQVAESGELVAYYARLKEHAKAAHNRDVDVDREFEQFTIDRYAEATDTNLFANIRRTAHLYWAKVFLTCAAIGLGVCTIPYFLLTGTDVDEAQKVEVVNPITIQEWEKRP